MRDRTRRFDSIRGEGAGGGHRWTGFKVSGEVPRRSPANEIARCCNIARGCVFSGYRQERYCRNKSIESIESISGNKGISISPSACDAPCFRINWRITVARDASRPIIARVSAPREGAPRETHFGEIIPVVPPTPSPPPPLHR